MYQICKFDQSIKTDLHMNWVHCLYLFSHSYRLYIFLTEEVMYFLDNIYWTSSWRAILRIIIVCKCTDVLTIISLEHNIHLHMYYNSIIDMHIMSEQQGELANTNSSHINIKCVL